jgi:hypothetical protein
MLIRQEKDKRKIERIGDILLAHVSYLYMDIDDGYSSIYRCQ